MARNTHPYISGANNITKMIGTLRNSFPAKVDSEVVKKYGIAPNGESSVINALQFIGIIDENGNRIEETYNVFLKPIDDDFQNGFSKIIEAAYHQLFDLHGEDAWTLDDDALLRFFRTTDKTSDVIGRRQVNVFRVFSALSGKADEPTKRERIKGKNRGQFNASKFIGKRKETPSKNASISISDSLGVSVKIDVNIPAGASKEECDNIFKSIREHLINDL